MKNAPKHTLTKNFQQEINSMPSTWNLRTWRLKRILEQLLLFKMYLRFRIISGVGFVWGLYKI